MEVLALYDVHGNVEALRAVLADPRAAGADVVVVGGDAVPGPFAGATLDALDALGGDVRWIRGNGEREVGHAARDERPDGLSDLVWETAQRSAAQLGAATCQRLAALELSVELDGVLFCHASPRADDEMLTRLSPERRYAAALDGVSAVTVVAGHTHQQDDRRVGAQRWVNAGSVGLPYEGSGDARWLWVVDGVPELRQTAYDAQGAGRRMLEAGWPDEASVGAALVDPVAAQTITALFEQASS